jgi:outer membrane lipoprotein carrier protein
MMQQMQIVVDRDAVLAYTRNGVTGNILPILASTVTDPNGNRTTIEFSNVRVNRGLSSSRFRFILPAGVEVLRPTGSEMGF